MTVAALAAPLSMLLGWLSWHVALHPVTRLRRRFGAHIVSSPPA